MSVLNYRIAKHTSDALQQETKTESPVSCLHHVNMENNKSSSSTKNIPKFALLFPPFMQNKRQKFLPIANSFPQVSTETVNDDVTQRMHTECKGKIASLEKSAAYPHYSNFRKDDMNEGKTSMLSRSKKVASKSNVSCEDNVTSVAICEDFQGLNSYKVECFAELGEQHKYLGSCDSDHRERNGDSRKDETDYQERDDVDKSEALRTLAHCESVLLSNERDEDKDANITDPFLAHKLYILPGRFDLRARTEELLEQRNIAETRELLRESKNRIVQSVKQVLDIDINIDLIICMLILQAICEQVILTVAKINMGIDIRTFINMIIIWALVDLKILDLNTLDEQERATWTKLNSFACLESPEVVSAVSSSKLQSVLLEVHRPKFSPHASMQLHRCLPWTLVSPAHERGVAKFYPTVRDRIDEMLPDVARHLKSGYVPDLTCLHFKEVPDKAYEIYKENSKLPEVIDEEQNENLLTQLVSIV